MAQFAIDELFTTGVLISGFIFDRSNSLGTAGQVLTATSSGVMWQADSSNTDLAALSGQIVATGALLDSKINSLSGYANNTFLSGNGITNYVPRWNGSKLLITGSIYDDGSKVGIGTNNPSYKLDTIGAIRASGELISEGNNARISLFRGNGINYFDWASGQSLYFSTESSVGGAGRNTLMSITSGGNVGINTVNAVAPIHIGGNATNNDPWMLLDINDTYFKRIIFSEERAAYGNTAYGGYIGYDADANTVSLGTYNNNVEYRSLNIKREDGNIGIGTTNPVSKLNIYSPVATAQIFNQLQLTNLGTANLGDIVGIGFAAGESTQYGVKGSIGFVRTNNYGRGALTFYTNNTAGTESVSTGNERLRIAANGNVGINTTSPNSTLRIDGSFSQRVNGGAFQEYKNIVTFNLDNYGVGGYVVQTPFKIGANYEMSIVHVKGYNYGNSSLYDFKVVFYDYGPSHAPINYSLIDLGNDGSPKYLAKDANNNLAICFGNSGDSNYYNRFTVDCITTRNGSSDYSQGWSAYQTSGLNYGFASTGVYQLNSPLNFRTSNYVGIGTTNPQYKLDVKGDVFVQGNLIGDDGTRGYLLGKDTLAAGRSYLVLDPNSTNGVGAGGDYLYIAQENTTGVISNAINGPIVFKGGGSEKVRIDTSNGYVGIGITNPSDKVQISGGSLSFTTSTGLAVPMLGITPINVAYVGPYTTTADGNAPTLVVFNQGASVQQTYFYSSGRVAMVLNKEGRFHIGGTNNSPPALLNVGPTSSVAAASGMSFGNDSSANLYRSAASTIKTDGSLEVTTNLNVGADLYVADELGVGVPIANKRFNYGAQIEAANASIQLVLGRGGNATGQGAIGADSSNTFAVWNISGGTTRQMVVTQQGNVGISSDVPAYKLDITGPATANGSTLRLNDAASVADSKHLLLTRLTSTGWIGVAGSQTNDPLCISRSNGYDLIVDSNGKIGAGIAVNLSGNVHIKNPSAGDQTLLVLEHSAGFSANTENRIDFYDDESHKVAARIAQYYSAVAGNRWGLKFYTNSSAAINSTPALTLMGNNNVGVGTTNPSEKLDVSGYILNRSKFAYTQRNDIVKNGLSFYVDFNNKTCFDSVVSSSSVKDISNNNYALTLVNAATISNKDGNTSLYTANNSSYLQIASYVMSLPHTWEAWVNGDAYGAGGSGWDTIWDSGGLGMEKPLIGTINGTLNVYPNTNDCGTLVAGKWYHIVVTTDASSNIVTYINGVQTASFAYVSTFSTGTGAIWLGGDISVETFNGYIPIARTYNRVLSSTEVMQNYNAEKWRFDNSSTFYHNVANGYVGIGTIIPAGILNTVGTGDQVIRFAHSDNVAGRKVTLRLTNNNSTYADAGVYIQAIEGAGIDSYAMAFGTTTSTATTSDTKMLLDNAGNLGIGTTSPLARLHIMEPNGSNDNVYQRWSYTNSVGVYDLLLKQTVTSNVVRYNFSMINNSTTYLNVLVLDRGNVGLGTTNPNYQLTVIGANQATANVTDAGNKGGSILVGSSLNASNQGGSVLFANVNDAGTYTPQWAIKSLFLNGNGYGLGDLAFSSRRATGDTSLTESVRFTYDGKVGIGTNSPSYKLDIYQTTNDAIIRSKTTAAGAYVYLDTNTAGYYGLNLLTNGTSNWFLGSYGGTNDLIITRGINGKEYVRVNTVGNVGIGTASPASLVGIGGTASTTAASGITFGGDAQANLYRSAEDTIRTDGAFIAGGYIRALSYVQLLTNLYPDSYGDNLNLNIGNSALNSWETAIKIKPGSYVGIGTTQPSGKLHVVSSVANETVLRVDGTNGTLLSVVDDLSDSLFSVNNGAGLPVLEVFADDRIVAGQYNSGDFVLVNNKIGIGTTNPVNKLSVVGSASIGSRTYNTTAPANGLIIEGKVGIGTSSVDSWAQLKVIGTTALGGITYVTDKIQALTAFPGSAASLLLNTDGGNVGIGLGSPQKFLDVLSSSNDFVTVGARTLGVGNWCGIHFGYREDNNLYRKSAIVFERTDLTSSNAQGKIHILNGPQAGSSNATLADAKITINEAGNVGIGITSPAHILQISGGSLAFTSSTGLAVPMLGITAINVAYVGPYNTSTDGNAPTLVTFNQGASVQQTYFYSSGRIAMVLNKEGRLNIAGNAGNTPPALLNVGPTSSVTAVSGMSFGNDASANLYRSATSTIKTDGDLVVVGNVTAANLVSGSGTTNYVTKWNGTKSVTNSQIFDDGTYVGINTVSNTTYRLQVNGSFAATTKSFDIVHPTVSGKRLTYASLEGPENGVYYRGQNNNNEINLPHYWSGLVHEDSLTVNLTAVGKRKDGKIRNYSVDQIGHNKVYIYTDSDDNIYNYYYTIFAERKDVSKLVTERYTE